MKFNTCPGVTQKYSGTFAGTSAEALLAVTTALLSMVTHRGQRRGNTNLPGLTAERCGELRGIGLCRSDLSDYRPAFHLAL
jgi:hypothetical protein